MMTNGVLVDTLVTNQVLVIFLFAMNDSVTTQSDGAEMDEESPIVVVATAHNRLLRRKGSKMRISTHRSIGRTHATWPLPPSRRLRA
jgi:hypothetical protein